MRWFEQRDVEMRDYETKLQKEVKEKYREKKERGEEDYLVYEIFFSWAKNKQTVALASFSVESRWDLARSLSSPSVSLSLSLSLSLYLSRSLSLSLWRCSKKQSKLQTLISGLLSFFIFSPFAFCLLLFAFCFPCLCRSSLLSHRKQTWMD